MVERRVQEGLHTSQMTEESINVELVEWLKKNWSTIVLVAAIAVLAFRGATWWQQRIEDRRSDAWADLMNVGTVPGLLEVADDHASIGSISELAWLRAADMHYQQLLFDEPMQDDESALLDPEASEEDAADSNADEASEDGTEATETAETEASADDSAEDEAADATEEPQPTGLSAEERAELIDKMESMYQRVLDSSQNDPGKSLFALRAAFGMAVVAEMRQDFDDAERWYRDIESKAGDRFVKLGRVAQVRRENMRDANVPVRLYTRDELSRIDESKGVPSMLERIQGGDMEPTLLDDSVGEGDVDPVSQAELDELINQMEQIDQPSPAPTDDPGDDGQSEAGDGEQGGG